MFWRSDGTEAGTFRIENVLAAGPSGVIQCATSPVSQLFDFGGTLFFAGTANDGTFTLTNIPPGSYTLNVLGPNIGALPLEVASMPLVVNGEDILGLTIATGSGASIQGMIVADNGSRLPTSSVAVEAVPLQSGSATWSPRDAADENGTFVLEGEAEAAMSLYVATVPNTHIAAIERKDGKVHQATLSIAGQHVRFFDSPAPHAFKLTPSFSFFLECESEEELRRLAAALGEGQTFMPIGNYGFSRLFAWVGDQFGVTWQLNLA